MSGKKISKMKKALNSETGRIVKEFLAHVYTRSLFDRLRFAWVIVRKK